MSAILPERHQLVELMAAIDSRDTDAFLEFLTEDSAFHFGSAPAVHGRGAIRNVLNDFFASIAGLQHTIGNVIASGDTLICEGTVVYERLDSREVSIPFVNIFEYAGQRIAEYKIYIDIGPLYAD
jgi:limonene-1,2-epoxide hydrolase